MTTRADEWREDLVRLLVASGTVGLKQSEVTTRLHHKVEAEYVVNELKALWAQEKVQRFTIPAKGKQGREGTIWRATVKIKEDLI